MARLQRFLAIPMAATAVGCLWLLYRQAGTDGLLIGLGAIFWLAVCLRTFGNSQRGKVSRGWGWGALAFAAVMIPSTIIKLPASGAPVVRIPLGAEAWSPEAVRAELAKGHPVFVYFTADWCLTCKANEAAAIEREATRDAFGKAGVKVLVGDWTNGDPAITRFLESRGRAGVPLYLWYQPGKAEPEELPQILTPGMLSDRALRPRR
jgi:thiol:disulfide interchange protein